MGADGPRLCGWSMAAGPRAAVSQVEWAGLRPVAGGRIAAAMSPDERPEKAALAAMPLDAHERLAIDLPCAECGHNLRGLRPGGVCVECGLPIALSRSASPLALAGPAWLARVSRGTGLAFAALPWLWLPLSWPLLLMGTWWMASADPGSRGQREALAGATRVLVVLAVIGLGTLGGLVVAEDAVLPSAARIYAVLLPAGVLTELVALAALRLVRRVRMRSWTVVLGMLGVAAGVALALVPMLDARQALDWLLYTVVGVLAASAGAMLVGICLARVWHRLDLADALALSRVRQETLRAERPAIAPPGAAAGRRVPR